MRGQDRAIVAPGGGPKSGARRALTPSPPPFRDFFLARRGFWPVQQEASARPPRGVVNGQFFEFQFKGLCAVFCRQRAGRAPIRMPATNYFPGGNYE